MFSKKDKDYSSVINQVTIIGKDVQFVGDLKTKDDIRVEGNITGCIISDSRVIIGIGAHILGSVEGESVDVLGVVIGDIKSKTYVSIGSSAVVEGDVDTETIKMESGAKVYGYVMAQGKGKGNVPFSKKIPNNELSRLSLGKNNSDCEIHDNSTDLLDTISQKVYNNSHKSNETKSNDLIDVKNDQNGFW
jgi:cytoskeletal protein CcmA (bactofilin family)